MILILKIFAVLIVFNLVKIGYLKYKNYKREKFIMDFAEQCERRNNEKM